jgi:glyoxylase-like metal-dependent hydrolase (beta-lactamase superfamily II)
MLLRETFPVGAFECNCTILACGDTKEAVVIDPGGDAPHIKDVLEHYDLSVRAIIHTHAHLDHIHGTRDVKEAHGGDIVLHRDDLSLYEGIAMQAMMFGWKTRASLPVDRFCVDGDTLEFGKRKALVIHTPGHTPGSVCFEVLDGRQTLLFAGDTLFRRSIGRTDLPGGNSRQILDSIRTRLYAMAPDTLVVPGHGPNTTIEEEAAQNPFVRARG